MSMRIACVTAARAAGYLAVGSLLVGCGGSETDGTGGSGAGTTADVTYFADAKPILDGRCVNCHQAGGIAPFALETLEQARTHKDAIKAAVADRRMPPWKPGPDCNDYLGDSSLSDAQIAMLGKWADLGGPAGDPSVVKDPLITEGRPLSRIDLEVGMTAPFTMDKEPDEYRCFVLDYNETTVKYVTGLGVAPGNSAVVHHVIAFLAEPGQVADAEALDAADPKPGYECFGGPGFSSGWLGSWAPGNPGYDYPEGTGIRIEPGSKIVMQMHYNSLNGGPAPDQTSVQLRLDESVEHEAFLQPWANPAWLVGTSMSIPAATSDVRHSWAQDPTVWFSGGKPMVLHSVGLHMHELGQTISLSIERADAGETCLLEIPEWDFHWQGGYAFKTPVTLNPGDRLSLSCSWDNPTMQEVAWGEGTGDEMCLGVFYYTVP